VRTHFARKHFPSSSWRQASDSDAHAKCSDIATWCGFGHSSSSLFSAETFVLHHSGAHWPIQDSQSMHCWRLNRYPRPKEKEEEAMSFFVVVSLLCTLVYLGEGYNIGTNWWNGNAFSAVIQPGGHVVSWGTNEKGAIAPAGLRNVINIVSTDKAFVALKNDGKIEAWGHIDWGGIAPVGLTGIVDVFSHLLCIRSIRPRRKCAHVGLGGIRRK